MTLQNKTTAVLCQLLQTGDEADRCYAARTLGVLKAPSAVALLIERLRDEDIDVCVDAAEALGNIGDVRAVPALIQSLENEPSGEICRVIAETLGKIGGKEATDALIKVSTERPEALEWEDDWDTWWDVQLEAIKALGKIGAEEAVEPITNLIDDEGQQDIENEILRALATIPGKGVGAVIARLQDRERRVQQRCRAARALIHCDSTAATKAIGRALKDPAPELRAEAILALAAKHADKYLNAIALMLRDPNAEVRNAAIKAIIQLSASVTGTEGLLEALLPLLSDPSSQVRATLINALIPVVAGAPLPDDHFVAVLDSLSDPSAETATAACTLLGRNGNPAVIPALLALIADATAHPMVRREAALSIGRLGKVSHEIIDTLAQAVGDRQQPVRLAALTALMALESAGAVTEDAARKGAPRRPLEIIIDAVNGNIEPAAAETGGADDGAAPPTPAQLRGQELAAERAMEQPAPEGPVVEFGPEDAQSGAEAESPTEPGAEKGATTTAEGITLPETPAQIVQAGEVQPATSTLDAIAMGNVEAMLAQQQPPEGPEYDETTREYLKVVEENKEIMRRIRANQRISPAQDVRRLGARVLAESEDQRAVETLLAALNDEDQLVRREAAEAIGTLALGNRKRPKLQDAVGTLITQLAIGDLEQKVTCARSLACLGNRAALPPLIEALKDPQINVRIQAIDALTQLSTEGEEPEAAGHMVIHDVPPLSVARKLSECLDDEESGVRVAAARGLARILTTVKDDTFTKQCVDKIISSVTGGTGEEARLMGRILRHFDTHLGCSILTEKLQAAEDSVKRSVFIEMIEELLHPDQGQPEQAA